SMYLTPDEHVFGCERDLFVAVSHVRAHRVHDLVFGKIDLWIQIGNTKLAAPAAACGHLDDAERGARVGKEDLLAIHRMFYFDDARQLLSFDRLSKQLERVSRLAASLDDAIDAQLVVQICLDDLPAAGAADDHFEVVAIRAGFDL